MSNKFSSSDIIIRDNAIFSTNSGKKFNVFQDLLNYAVKCCGGYECCENVYFGTDKATGVRTVGYFLNSVWTVTTYEQYKQDKKDGLFNY